jgi:dihydropyrimidine dehydrogenase (NADP+)
MSPQAVETRKDNGRISHIILARNEQDDDGNWNVDEDQTMRKKCDFIISAFGSGMEEFTK